MKANRTAITVRGSTWLARVMEYDSNGKTKYHIDIQAKAKVRITNLVKLQSFLFYFIFFLFNSICEIITDCFSLLSVG